MRTLLTRLWILIVLSILVIGAGVSLTVLSREPLWVAVAGSALTLLGAVSACRKFIRLGLAETLVSNVPIGGGAILPTEDDLDLAREEDLDDRAAILATALILIGTPMQICGYLMTGY
jgi:hypothetical protein